MLAQLIPLLDLSSVLALATVQPLVLSLLQRSFIWKNLIRRSTVSGNELCREKIGKLVEILKLIEEPEQRLLELLHVICESYPEVLGGGKEEDKEENEEQDGEEEEDEEGYKEYKYFDLESVLVTCSVHPVGHKVSTEGFEVLELVEGSMGTTLQKVEEIEVEQFNENLFDFFLASALLARIKRQKEPLKKVKMNRVELLASTGATTTLLENAEKWDIRRFHLQRDYGEMGWSWLAENLKRNKYALETIWLSAVVMARAKREELKGIWVQNPGCQWWLEDHSPGPGPLPMQLFGFSQINIFVGGSTVEEIGTILDPAWREVELILENVKLEGILEKAKSELEELEGELVGSLQEPEEDQKKHEQIRTDQE